MPAKQKKVTLTLSATGNAARAAAFSSTAGVRVRAGAYDPGAGFHGDTFFARGTGSM
jgi:hypothetical protein